MIPGNSSPSRSSPHYIAPSNKCGVRMWPAVFNIYQPPAKRCLFKKKKQAKQLAIRRCHSHRSYVAEPKFNQPCIHNPNPNLLLVLVEKSVSPTIVCHILWRPRTTLCRLVVTCSTSVNRYNPKCQLGYIPNPVDLFYISIWEGDHRTHLEKGSSFTHRHKNLEGDWT